MNKTLEEILYNALKDLHDEQVDYVRKNNIGLPHHNQTMQNALIAITLYRENLDARAPKAEEPYPRDDKYVGKHT